MKKINNSLLVIGCMLILFGCNKANNINNDLQILGVNTENMEKIEIIHGNITLLPDKKQKDNLTLIEELNTFFVNAGDSIEIVDEDLGIALIEGEAYAQNDAENYYVYIYFTNPQSLSLKNSSNEYVPNCDGVLFDINNKKLYWSEDGNFKGTISYANINSGTEIDLSTFVIEIEKLL